MRKVKSSITQLFFVLHRYYIVINYFYFIIIIFVSLIRGLSQSLPREGKSLYTKNVDGQDFTFPITSRKPRRKIHGHHPHNGYFHDRTVTMALAAAAQNRLIFIAKSGPKYRIYPTGSKYYYSKEPHFYPILLI